MANVTFLSDRSNLLEGRVKQSQHRLLILFNLSSNIKLLLIAQIGWFDVGALNCGNPKWLSRWGVYALGAAELRPLAWHSCRGREYIMCGDVSCGKYLSQLFRVLTFSYSAYTISFGTIHYTIVSITIDIFCIIRVIDGCCLLSPLTAGLKISVELTICSFVTPQHHIEHIVAIVFLSLWLVVFSVRHCVANSGSLLADAFTGVLVTVLLSCCKAFYLFLLRSSISTFLRVLSFIMIILCIQLHSVITVMCLLNCLTILSLFSNFWYHMLVIWMSGIQPVSIFK